MDSIKLFKQVTNAITTIILYVLLLALIVQNEGQPSKQGISTVIDRCKPASESN
ncbi:hypothetical protein [Methanosarcina sp. 2.H.A.1B.4]|uniref:hypothetical protein n=1 Tax=Methanosarcina sp. 2.H.A.1B.4 TaxID=1483600 RepID=UPI000AB77C96|nr:hypothetical protein [Methanosarcina sp. 2.H.A.1B.4]